MALNTTENTTSLFTGKKFSDYKLILLIVDDTSDVRRASLIMPTSSFVGSTNNILQFNYSAVDYIARVKYVSDTSFKASLSASVNDITLKIVGILK